MNKLDDSAAFRLERAEALVMAVAQRQQGLAADRTSAVRQRLERVLEALAAERKSVV